MAHAGKPTAFDLVVVGAGSGGMAAAKRASDLGARVALVERGRIGGTCVLRGCIPKKWMVWAAQLQAAQEFYGSFGLRAAGAAGPHNRVDWSALVAQREALIDTLVQRHSHALGDKGIKVFEGEAHFIDAHTLQVGGTALTSDAFVLATGGSPRLGSWPGAENSNTSDAFFKAHAQPASATVVGGGYIAVELAGILARLGVPVTLVCRSTLLRAFDTDVTRGMVRALEQAGVRVLEHTACVSQEQVALGGGAGTCLTIQREQHEEQLTAQWVLTALGRAPNLAPLQLSRVGIIPNGKGHLEVDAQHRTQVPHIFAVGDITQGPELTPLAIRAGRRVAHLLFDPNKGGPSPANLDHLPTAVFGPTPLAAAGLTEAEARHRHGDDIGTRVSRFVPLYEARLAKARQVQATIKVVYRASTGLVLGLHMLGQDAPEIIQGMAVALSAGVTLEALDATVALHPTLAEEFVLMGGL